MQCENPDYIRQMEVETSSKEKARKVISDNKKYKTKATSNNKTQKQCLCDL